MTDALPPLLLQFAATVLLSFVLGLELHSYRRSQDEGIGFGTTRTLTLIGAIGFVLWLLDGVQANVGAPQVFLPPANGGMAAAVASDLLGTRGLYLAGLAVLAVWLAVDLWPRVARSTRAASQPADNGGALLPSLIALVAYALGPLVLTQPDWFVAAVMVVTILMLGEKPLIRRLSDAFPSAEGVTLAKFLIIAGLVLPLMPASPLPGLPTLSYQKVWLAVVAISGLSYLGYVAHRYIWPKAGTLVTGIIGGLYSSTAVTIVLGRESRTDAGIAAQAPAAIVVAIMMMYVRLLVLITLLGHLDAARALLLPFGTIVLGSGVVAFVLWRIGSRTAAQSASAVQLGPHNPLALPIALLFAALFIAFAAITQFITTHYGAGALKLLSLLVGFTDINPFILSLVATHGVVSPSLMVSAILVASVTNNLVNAGYALVLARQRAMVPVAGWFALCLVAALFWTGWL
ncbi:MAG: MgtC/SapB family protein [Thiomonas sp.]|uniref:DUF4010 domain-containing protein n=1 Tax=mine drainage metagenome TaxID=410659 RepID=E6PRA6_9ZZZZ